MNSQQLNDWIQVIGIFGVMASLIFVGVQLRQDREHAMAQTFVDTAASFIDVSDLVISNADVWVRALDGEELSAEERLIFEQIALAWYRRRLSQHNTAASLRGESNSPRSTAHTIYNHPGLRAWFDSNYPATLAGGFTAEIRHWLERIDTGDVTPPGEKSYVVR